MFTLLLSASLFAPTADPAKYAKPDSTDLEADVKSGSNSFKFEMKPK